MNIRLRLVRLVGALEPRMKPAPAPRRLQTVQDVIGLLHEQVEAVRTDSRADPLAKAQTIGRLAGLALRAMEVGQLAARLEMLERVLKQRAEGDRL